MLNHLQKSVLRGDHLESFHNTWNMVLSELSEPPDPKLLQHLYFRPLQHFKPLAEDVAHYKRAKRLGSPNYSFEWLWEASNRYLIMKREDYMQVSLSRGLNGVSEQAALAIDPEENVNIKAGAKKRSTTPRPLTRPKRRRPPPG